MDNETVIDFLPCAFLYILSHLKWAHVDSGVLKQGILKTEFCFSELYKASAWPHLHHHEFQDGTYPVGNDNHQGRACGLAPQEKPHIYGC